MDFVGLEGDIETQEEHVVCMEKRCSYNYQEGIMEIVEDISGEEEEVGCLH